MSKRILMLLTYGLVAFACLQFDCVYTMPPRPAPMVEVVGVRPYGDAVWAPGHWQWRRWAHRYVWVRGHWKVYRGGGWVIIR